MASYDLLRKHARAGAHDSVNGDRVAVLDMKSRGVKELPRLPAVRGDPGVVVDGDEV